MAGVSDCSGASRDSRTDGVSRKPKSDTTPAGADVVGWVSCLIDQDRTATGSRTSVMMMVAGMDQGDCGHDATIITCVELVSTGAGLQAANLRNGTRP